MKRPVQDDRSWKLADAACNEQLSAAEQAELAEQIANDADAAQLYADYCLLHIDLRLAHLSDRALEATRSAIFTNAEQTVPRVAPRRRDWLSRHITRKSITVAIVTTAAALLLMATLQVPVFVSDKQLPNQDDEVVDEKGNAIATMTVSRHVVWNRNHRLWGRQPRIDAGKKLAFTSGLVEITYDTGARVVLEGPAEFTVGQSGKREAEGGEITNHQPANSGYLHVGKLVARVEGASANGFTVQTPAGSIKDLGTEFALSVLLTGDSLVHVFEGKVEVHGEGPVETIAAGGSLTLASSGSVASRDAVPSDQFVRTIPVRRNVRVLIDEDFTSGRNDGNRWISNAPGEVVGSAWIWSSPNNAVTEIRPETWLGTQGASTRMLATTYDHDRNPNSREAPIPGGLEIMSDFKASGSEQVTMVVSAQVRLPETLDTEREGVLTLYVANRLAENEGGRRPQVRIVNLTDEREILPYRSLGPFGPQNDHLWNFRSIGFALNATDGGDLIEVQFEDTVHGSDVGDMSARGLQLADLRLDVGVENPEVAQTKNNLAPRKK